MPGEPSQQLRLQKLLKKGVKHQREGRGELAEACYRKIMKLDPMSAEARQMQSLLQGKMGQMQPEIHGLQQARKVDPEKPGPESAEAHLHLGQEKERLGDLQAAANSYRSALVLKPDSPELHCHLARVLCRGGALEPAAELYRRALALAPPRHDNYSDVGCVLTDLGRFEAALEAFRRALTLNRHSARTIACLGRLFERKCDLLSAADAFRDAIKLDPALRPAYVDLGFVLYGLGELAEASDCFYHVLQLQPDSAEATANLALIHLVQGHFSVGWPEYEWRWKVGVGDDRRFVERQWKGEPLQGEGILLYAEQGLGDTMQFVRYAPLVAARGGKVILEVQPALHGLLGGMEGVSQVVSRGDPLPHFTWQCPLLSLPLAFGTEMGTIPAKVPYLFPDPVKMEEWQGRLAGNTRRIGLAWAGNPKHPRDRIRSIALDQLIALMKVPGTTFYSLQFGPGAEQTKQLPADVRLIDLAEELKDFANVAAIVANLDLVICIDSSMAHLAGAMGKPVWILLNKGCDWRWLREREDSPWYPTARLFRQTIAGAWEEVVSRIESELQRFATNQFLSSDLNMDQERMEGPAVVNTRDAFSASAGAPAMDIHVINLDRSKDRMAAFKKVNGWLPLKFLRFAGIEGKSLSRGTLVDQGLITADLGYNDGALGCALSHLALWDLAIEKDELITICEDDAIFNRGFVSSAEALLKTVPPEWHVILWGWNFDSSLLFDMLPGVSPCLAAFNQSAMRMGAEAFQSLSLNPQPFKIFSAFGAVGYSLSPTGARTLKKHCFPLRKMDVFVPGLGRSVVNFGIDVMLNDAYQKINAYASFPPLVITKNDHGISTVQQKS